MKNLQLCAMLLFIASSAQIFAGKGSTFRNSQERPNARPQLVAAAINFSGQGVEPRTSPILKNISGLNGNFASPQASRKATSKK